MRGNKLSMVSVLRTFLLASIASVLLVPAVVESSSVTKGLGPRDALLVMDTDDRIVVAHNPGQVLVPASTLKVITALAARHYLGENFRFQTEFFLDAEDNLLIRGYGDPLLVSEVLADIARTLSQRIKTPINAILLDDRFFGSPLVIPGVSSSTNPYDAPNGALCVNFNTVNFSTHRGQIVSAEPQTPLLPMAMQRIRASGLSRGRVVLSHHGHNAVLYAGAMFKHFFEKAGLRINGPVRLASETPTHAPHLVYRHTSPYSLNDLTAKLLEFSNNFMANQLLIAAGAQRYGAPGNLTKGAKALNAYATDILGIADTQLVEGSGISRDNRISARTLMTALASFEPHRHLMTHRTDTYFKTGTLKGIRTRVGYIEMADGRRYRFVILLNTPGRRTEPILQKLRAFLQR